jgi:allantoin racemase
MVAFKCKVKIRKLAHEQYKRQAMKVILINPNSTEAMTLSSVETAQKTAPEINFEGWTSFDGPPSIQGEEDGNYAIKPMLELVKKANKKKPSAIIIGCFDDTGLEQAREISLCPVLGIGESSFLLSYLFSGETAVITTVHEAVPIIKKNIKNAGYSTLISEVIAADVEVLDLEFSPAQSAVKFAQASKALNRSTQNIILGCAGAVKIKDEFETITGYKSFDGVTSAAKLCRALL